MWTNNDSDTCLDKVDSSIGAYGEAALVSDSE